MATLEAAGIGAGPGTVSVRIVREVISRGRRSPGLWVASRLRQHREQGLFVGTYPLRMDLRGRLRSLVNREDYLSPWRLALMRVIDPVEWYMRKDDEDNINPRRLRKGGWTHAPAEEPINLELRQRALEEASRRRDATRKVREALRRDHASLFEAKARELLDRNEVTIQAENGQVEAKLVRFRNGAVFEYVGTSSKETGHGMTRIAPSQLAGSIDMLARRLENAVLNLGTDPGPLN